MGGGLHCGISDTVRFVFGYLNYHNQISFKDNAEVTPTDVYIIRSRSVPRVSCPLAHFWVHCIYSSEGIKSVRSKEMAVVGQNSGTGSRRYPRSFLLC